MVLLAKWRFFFTILICLQISNINGSKYESIKSGLSDYQIKKSSVRLHIFTAEKLNKTFELKFNKIYSGKELASVCPTKSEFKYIVHGFAERWDMTFRWNWVNEMIVEMLKNADAPKLCLIVVDWKELANGGALIANYWNAINNMKISGDLITNFLKANKHNPGQMHCIGFSLGAHGCSIFYKVYYQKFKVEPRRITGLDPAGPFFEEKPLDEKLNYNDAEFVDIIHTSQNFGLADNLGHMDFYQDSGASDIKACDKFTDRSDNLDSVILYEESNTKNRKYDEVYLTSADKLDFSSLKSIKSSMAKKAKSLWGRVRSFFYKKPKRIFLQAHQFFGCSHIMAMRYFLYSINTCEFAAVKCKDINEFKNNACSRNITDVRMGYYAELSSNVYKKSRSKFYLNTKEKAPYCYDPM